MNRRLHLICVLCAVAGFAAVAQSPPAGQAPPAGPPPAGQGARGAGQGRGFDDTTGADFLPRPPVTRLSPEQQQRLFLLPEGYRIEPVLTDPLIEDPVGMSFDGNGRMYVIEMRSYMQDANGSNSRAPVSRISRHEDTNGDGTYDRHTVFADGLVLPRIAYPLDDGVVLVLETDNRDLFKYTDTNGDGVSDKKELFYSGAGRVTNMEWQPSGLMWALDNWLYMTYNPYRLRIMPGGKLLREDTEPNGGQWGVSQDNYGKLWFVDGGGELGPVNFQVPIVYGAFNVPDHIEEGFRVPWPAPGGIGDMQGGMRRVRTPEGTLNNFTAASGSEIVRAHRLPPDIQGDLLFGEPVGRIVRRAKVVVTDGLTQLKNAHPMSEFLRSTDPLFRPVSVHNAPDGTIYVADMYTGIIQDAQFVGTYLRRKVEQYGLDKQHNWGRIWRITYDGLTPDRTAPRMYRETAAQLVRHLEHPNGWWRDTAQKLLVLRRDTSVVPALTTMALTSPNQLARIHALWTLEGLGALTAPMARESMKSPDPQIRIQAIRVSETLYKAGDKSFAGEYRAMTRDADPNVAIQAMLTVNLHRLPDYEKLIRTTAETSQVRGVRELGQLMLRPSSSQGQRPSLSDTGANAVNLSLDQRRILTRGEATYRELCFTCHAADGKGAPMAGATDGTTLGPPLGGAARVVGHRDYVIKVLLHGLTGPLDGKAYGGGGVMVPMGTNTDEWIADVASYIRNSFGNSATFVTPEQVAAIRKTASRRSPWTFAELDPTIPKPLSNAAEWTLTASHNQGAAGNPVKGAGRWDTAAPQQPGMWFQIELPQVTSVTELQVDPAAPPAARGGIPFGRGARGAGPPAPARGPIAFTVQVSRDGTTWSAPVAQGPGATGTTIMAFRPVQAKFIRITQTGTAATNEMWAVGQIRVYQAGSGK